MTETLKVVKFETFDGKEFYSKYKGEEQIKNFFREYMKDHEAPEKPEKLNQVTLLDMSEDEYYRLPATNESYKYLGVEE